MNTSIRADLYCLSVLVGEGLCIVYVVGQTVLKLLNQ